MSFLNKDQLGKSLDFLFREDTYDPKAIDRAAYNLRLGKDVFRSSSEIPQTLTDEDPYVTIRSGDYVLLTTAEYLTMPLDMLGFITLRYRYKKLGLMNVSGFQVDPGFKGKLVFSVFNVGNNDVVLKFQEKMFMLFVTKLEEANKVDPDEKHEHDEQESFSLEDVIAIKGRSASLVQMESRLGSIESSVTIYGAIVIGALLVLFALVIGLVLQK